MVAKHRNKRYDKELGDKYDPKAKKAATEFLEQLGFSDMEENLDEGKNHSTGYWDLSAKLGDKTIIVETEIKEDKRWRVKWKDNDHKEVPFSYSTIDVPKRKEKIKAKFVMIFNFDLDRLIIIESDEVKRSPVSDKWVHNTKEEEPFFNISLPNSHSRFYHRIEGVWTLARSWDSNLNLIEDIRQKEKQLKANGV